MKECEEKLKGVHSREPRDWLAAGNCQRRHTCEACRGARVTLARELQDKNFNLAR